MFLSSYFNKIFFVQMTQIIFSFIVIYYILNIQKKKKTKATKNKMYFCFRVQLATISKVCEGIRPTL